jgi:tripartite-type tricarboxylate transporter receptor subunit TctC
MLRILLSFCLAFAFTAAQAQTYPARPVRIIAGFPPGGAADLLARLVADKLSAALGQPFVVENRAGAGGTLGADLVAKAPGDGYTLLLGLTASQTIAPAIYKSLPYHAERDFKPVSLVATIPVVLVVHPAVAAANPRELVALARTAGSANAPLQFASSGSGAIPHLTAELFQAAQGVKMVHVPYKGAPLAMADLLAGRVGLMFDNLPTVLPHIRSGKLRALGVAQARRARALPELPTLAEAGVSGVEVASWFGVLAPASTPDAVVALLQREIVRQFAAEDVRTRLDAMGAEPATSTPEEFARLVRAETAKWAKIVKDTGAGAE